MGLLGELFEDMGDTFSDINLELKRVKQGVAHELRRSCADIFGSDDRRSRFSDAGYSSARCGNTPTPPPIPSAKKAAPAPPPIAEAVEEDVPFKGMYSPKLEMLIDAAITDGILTDSERRLLINNVLLEGWIFRNLNWCSMLALSHAASSSNQEGDSLKIK